MPSELGRWWRATPWHLRGSRAGVWERAFAGLRDAGLRDAGLRDAGLRDLGEVFLDGTNLRAPHKAAGAKGGRAGRPWAARAAATAQRLAGTIRNFVRGWA